MNIHARVYNTVGKSNVQEENQTKRIYGKNGKNERKNERSNKISSFDERMVGEDGDKERVKGIPNKAYS